MVIVLVAAHFVDQERQLLRGDFSLFPHLVDLVHHPRLEFPDFRFGTCVFQALEQSRDFAAFVIVHFAHVGFLSERIIPRFILLQRYLSVFAKIIRKVIPRLTFPHNISLWRIIKFFEKNQSLLFGEKLFHDVNFRLSLFICAPLQESI